MSLLNDALRKKEREMRLPVESAPGAIAPITPRSQRRRLSWIVGIGTAALLAAGLGIGLTVQSIEAPSASILPPPSYRLASQSIVPEILPSPAVETVPPALSVPLPEANGSPAVPGNDARIARREPILRTPIHPNSQVSPSQVETRPLPQSPNTAVPGDLSTTPLEDSDSTQAVEMPAQTVPPSDRHGDVVVEPPLAERYLRKALAYHQQGHLERSIALYREVLQLQPDHFDARFNLASAYIERGEFGHAHRIAQALYHQDNTNPQVITNLAIAKIGLGQYRQALTLLDRIADTPQAESFTVYLHKGIACCGLHQLDAAIGWYQKAEGLNPDQPQLLFNLALAYDRRQEYSQALRYYQAHQKVVSDGRGPAPSGVQQRITALRSYLAAAHSQERFKP
jgi:Tfp pilus assembly protein PilF